MDFITHCNRALGHQRHEELVAYHKDINEQPKVASLWPMQTQMVKIYTKTIFLSFQQELFQSNAYIVTIQEDENDIYIVQRVDQSISSRHRIVTFDKYLNIVSCSYMHFDFKGLPCRHMLAYFRVKQIIHLPTHCILKILTRNVKVGGVMDNNGQEIAESSITIRHSRLSQWASTVVDDASLTSEGTNLLVNEMEMIHGKIKEMDNSHSTVLDLIGKKSSKEPKSIINPTHVRSKGCGKRFKSSKEISISTSRLYRGCGLQGQSHDKRNCPKLHKR